MSDPNLSMLVNDQGGVVAPSAPAGALLVVGVGSQAPSGGGLVPDTAQWGTIFGCGSDAAISNFFGTGALVDAATLTRQASARGPNGGTVYACNIFSGTMGATTHVGAGLGTIAFSGNPMGPYVVIAKITSTGAIGVGKFQWSLDNGDNYNGVDIVIPAGGTYVIPNSGVTLTFNNNGGNFANTDTYKSTATQNPGSVGAVVETGSGTGVVGTTGSPNDAYGLVVSIIKGGDVGVATFQFSLDGGRTFSATITTAATYAIAGTGLTLTFANGAGSPNSFIVGNLYSFACTAPTFTTTDLVTLFNRLQALQRGMLALVKGSWIVGKTSSPSAFATLISTCDTIAGAMETNSALFRHLMIVEGPTDTAAVNIDAGIISATASSASDFVCPCAGDINVTDPNTGTQKQRGCAWMVAPRVAQVRSGEDAGFVGRGPAIGVTAILRDETSTPGLNDARISSARQFNGKQGFFITKARIISVVGSSFNTADRVVVMGDAMRAAYPVLLDHLNEDVRVVPGVDSHNNPISVIDPRDAANIEKETEAAINAALGINITSVSVHIDRTVDLLLTETINVTVAITPKGKQSQIITTFQFVNPALVQALAA